MIYSQHVAHFTFAKKTNIFYKWKENSMKKTFFALFLLSFLNASSVVVANQEQEFETSNIANACVDSSCREGAVTEYHDIDLPQPNSRSLTEGIEEQSIKSHRLDRVNKIKNLIFEGGGIKGIGYLGAIERLSEQGLNLDNIERVGGTSAGAIMALLLGLNYQIDELSEIINLDFTTFLDGNNPAYHFFEKIKDKNIQEIGPELIKLKFDSEYELFNAFNDHDFLRICVSLAKYFKITTGMVILREVQQIMHLIGAYLGFVQQREMSVVATLARQKMFSLMFSLIDLASVAIPPYQTYKKVEDLTSLFMNNGAFNGDKFRAWIEERIYEKTDIINATFSEIHELKKQGRLFKDIYVIGVNINTQRTEIFSYEHTPNMVVADAIRISMSIPLVFKPHQGVVKNQGDKIEPTGQFYVDGGLNDNYPLWLFDNTKYSKETSYNEENTNWETIGLRLDSSEEIKEYLSGKASPKPIDSFVGFLALLGKALYYKQDSDHALSSSDQERTIYIDTLNYSTLDFSLKYNESEKLRTSGRNAVDKYIGYKK